MKQPKTPKHGKKILQQLRLAVARATVRYALDTRGVQPYIPDGAELSELCDEYALRALAIWLATTCGSHICRSAMSKSNLTVENSLLSAMVRTNEYPFANPIEKELENEINRISQEQLSTRLVANVELLGTMFELIANQSLDVSLENDHKVGFDIQAKERRRSVGQFYTPPLVVKYCFDIAFQKSLACLIKRLKSATSETIWADDAIKSNLDIPSETSNFKALDPSAGTGNFLCGLIRYVRDKLSEGSIQKEEEEADDPYKRAQIIFSLAKNAVFGRELDPRAAALARLAVSLETFPEINHLCSNSNSANCVLLYKELTENLRKNIFASDSILQAAQLKTEGVGEFDLVITNPPYVSFGARNQKVLPASSARFLKRYYSQAAEYKVRYHSIFQDIAVRYAKSNASIVLLVPDGFLTGSFYRKLRQLLLLNTKLISFSELPARIIPEAVVGRWCVAHYEKGLEAADYDVELLTLIDEHGAAMESQAEITKTKAFSLSVNDLHDKSTDTFRMVFDKHDHALMKLTDGLERFSSVINGYTGIRSISGKNSITGKEKLSGAWRRGITSGAQVQRFRISWEGDWINIDPDLLFKGGFNTSIIESPKILVRQTGDSLVCALDNSGFYHLNNVHSFSAALKPNSTLNLSNLCALMNSTLWRHIYRLKTRETGRALAQVDIETVESMPYAQFSGDISLKVTSLTSRMADLLQADREHSCQNGNDLILFIERCIDRLVYDAYELEPEIIDRVEAISSKNVGSRKSSQDTKGRVSESYLPSTNEVEQFLKENTW